MKRFLSDTQEFRRFARKGSPPKILPPCRSRRYALPQDDTSCASNPKQAGGSGRPRRPLWHLLRINSERDKSSSVIAAYRRYIKRQRKDAFSLTWQKVEEEARFDGKWVLTHQYQTPADAVALKYKETLDGGADIPRCQVAP